MGWLTGWAYRKKVTLVEQSSGAYNDLPSIITAAYDAHMKTDFADCRFTESDGSTLIAYGIKTKTDEVECEFVIKRSYTSGASLTVYLYYGNSDAADASVDYGPWALAWYLANGFGKNPSAHHGSGDCAAYDHSETDDIPSWPEHVFGGCTANGGYRAFYGHVKINGTGAKWASTVLCFGIATRMILRWAKYSCTTEQYDHASFVKGASNTVEWGHYSGGNTGYWVSWYPAEPSVSFGAEEEPSIDLPAKFELGQDSADLLARFNVAQGSADLLGKFEVGQNYAELLGEAVIRHPGSAELLGQFESQATAELLGEAVIRQVGTPVELLGRAVIRNIGSAELLGNGIIRHSDSVELLGKFDAQDIEDLLGKGVVRNIGSAELLVHVLIGRPDSTALLGNVDIRHVGTPVELLGRVVIRHVGIPIELLGNADVQHSDFAELLSKFDVGQDSADLLGQFDVGQDSVDLLARFEVGQGAEEFLGKVAIRHPASSDLKFSLYVSPWYLTAVEMLVGGRDRRMDLGGRDREMVVGGRNRRMRIR